MDRSSLNLAVENCALFRCSLLTDYSEITTWTAELATNQTLPEPRTLVRLN
jgi:hypothetical protein